MQIREKSQPMVDNAQSKPNTLPFGASALANRYYAIFSSNRNRVPQSDERV